MYNRPQKILLTANTAWNLAHFRIGLIRALQNEGHQVVALSPVDDSVQVFEEIGVRHLPIEMDNKGTSAFQDLRLINRFRKAFRAERPDIVLSFTIKNNIYGGLAARATNTAFIPNVSGLGTAFLSEGWLERVVTGLYRGAFRRLPNVMFQNTDDRDLFLKKGIVTPNQPVLLPGSGIDLEAFSPTPQNERTNETLSFLLIARLLRDKGVCEFVDAARTLRTRFPELKFQLLGEAGAENRTAISADEVRTWVEEGVVEYLGTTNDVRPYIAASDCVVLPSYREGTPRALLEAAAMGRPLVATDVPGCRNVVAHGENGFLCRVRNASDLARWMEQIVEIGPDKRASFGEASRLKVEREFDQQIVIDTYLKTIAGQVGN